MVGILVISHGKLCEGIVDSVSMVAGQMDQLETVSLKPGMSPDTYRDQVKEAATRLDTGDGVIVLIDLLGGTPFNTITLLSKDLNVSMITGMNMAMLIGVALSRTEDSTLTELAEIAESSAVTGIKILARENDSQEDADEDDDL